MSGVPTWRLAVYLAACYQHEDAKPITSAELGEAAGVNDSMVRRDLLMISALGGKRGVGFATPVLGGHLAHVLEARADLDDVARLYRRRSLALGVVANVLHGIDDEAEAA